MKTIPPPCPEPEIGPKYWRGLDQLADTPEFRQWAEREFPAGASELSDPQSRRHFVKIMSASFLLAGLGGTGCRRPVENIVPFSKMPEGYIHGVYQFYASAMPTRTGAIPLLVRSHEGRPIKIEGNAQHPDSNGGTDAFAQAEILNLYDPDRANRFTKNGNSVSREVALDFLVDLSNRFKANGGEGLSFLLDHKNSPTRDRLVKLIRERFPKAVWHAYEPVDFDIYRRGATAAFGKTVTPQYHLDKASVVLSLDCDFLGQEEDATRMTRGYAKGRAIEKPDGNLNRVYTIESLMTLTGANSDHRLRRSPAQITALAAQFATAIVEGGQVADKWVAECAKDLLGNKGKCVVMAGYRQPLEVHILAHAMNQALGNIGQTVDLLPAIERSETSIADLAKDLNDGKVDTLVMLGGNPVYTAPVELNWEQAQRKAKQVVRLGYHEDETFAASTWHLPEAHFLEAWGDARTSDGTVVPIQPLISPIFGGITQIEVLARLAGVVQPSGYDVVRETFHGLLANPSEDAWKKFLHDGFLADTAAKPATVQFNNGLVANAKAAVTKAPANSTGSLEVVFYRDHSLDDGRFANNGWLQELPDPITKMTWENVIMMSPKTAKDLGLVIEDREDLRLNTPEVRLTLNGKTVEGASWAQPGMADNTIALALGYGRSRAGRVGNSVGYNAYVIRTGATPYAAAGAKLEATGRTRFLSCTQNHGSMEGRPIIREANLETFKQHPNFAQAMNMEMPPSEKPLYANPLDKIANKVHQWGMSIDLNRCVGCSACMIACQSENNVPIVGKMMVARNREMHWLRIDRYYAGTKEDPQVVNQPMLCQHCEAAPCESVCPVNATVHDDEGINTMVYNRCVGTRYCSNNCPYKVRRFNFFDYNRRPLNELYKSPLVSTTDGQWELLRWFKDPDRGSRKEDEWQLTKLAKNPDVTVRMRGVMEKCTYCIQRIEGAKIAQKVKAGASGDIAVPDRTIKTACEQACPAEAIVFGNVADPESQVSKLKGQVRDYKVLEFLSTRPRTTYLARVRNPNKSMPDYYDQPLSSAEFLTKGGQMEFGSHGAEGAAEHGKPAAHEPAKAEKGAH
jgi:MoCo/4Fe-4S cofactor protein with predicted Tat translocation signal